MTEQTLRRIEAQQLREAEAVKRGIESYRRSLADSSLSDTAGGNFALRDVMKSLVPAIHAAQVEAAEGIASLPTKAHEWWWLIGLLPATSIAFITIRTFLTIPVTHREPGIRATPLAIAIANALKTEIEFEMWKRASKDRAAQLAEDTPEGERREFTHYERLALYSKIGITTKVFERWKRKLDEIERMAWTNAQKVHVGSKLVTLAVHNGGGWFELRLEMGKATKVLRAYLTEAARAAIDDINTRAETSRPPLLPMICRPKPWIKDETCS